MVRSDGEVGARLGLGVADREVDLAGEDAGQEARLLLVGAVRHDRRADGVDGDERERRMGALHLVEQDELIGRRPALAAELLRPAEAEPAVGAHLPHDPAELGVALAVVAHAARAPRAGAARSKYVAQLFAQRFLLGGFGEMHTRRDVSRCYVGI